MDFMLLQVRVELYECVINSNKNLAYKTERMVRIILKKALLNMHAPVLEFQIGTWNLNKNLLA